MTSLCTNFLLKDTELINFININDDEKRMVLTWRNHETIRKWMYSNDIISVEEHDSFINKRRTDGYNFYWIVKNKEKHYLGTIYLNKIDFKNRHAYLGIYSNPYTEIKNKGHFLIESLKELSFNIAKFHTLKLEVVECNQKAIAFYERSGFKEEGRLKEFVFKDGKWYDVIVMGIINNQ